MSRVNYINNIEELTGWFSTDVKRKAKELANTHGIKDSEVRFIVNYLRKNGVCVCSSQKGYWLANNNDEVVATIDSLKSRVFEIQKAINGLEQHLIDELVI